MRQTRKLHCRIPLSAALSESLAQWQAECLNPSNRSSGRPYASHTLHVVKWLVEFVDPEIQSWRDLKTRHARALVKTRLEAGYTVADVKKKLVCLRQWVRFEEDRADTDNTVSRSLFARIPRQDPKPPSCLDPEQAEWVMARAKLFDRTIPQRGFDDWPPMAFYCLVTLGIEAGLRPSELLYLRWDEIDTDGPVPHVALTHRPGRPLKNAKAARVIELSDKAKAAVTAYRSTFEDDPPGDWLFAIPTRDGAVRAPKAHKLWARLSREIGFKINCYTLRHTFATHRIMFHGLDDQGAANLLGHATPQTLQRYYLARNVSRGPLRLATGRFG
ncbi:MAG: site-specific integrase [Nitrospira sp.]|nr:site-specific integrase [Nitrospira sp.]